MSEKFTNGPITLLHMECMEYMAGLPNKAFDLAIVDPPYGIGEDGGKTRGQMHCGKLLLRGYAKKNWDSNPPDPEYFDQLRRVSRNQIIWGANHFIDNFTFNSSSPCWVVWDKENGECDFADVELAWTSFKTAARQFRYRWAGMLQANMKDKEIRIHPTQKPRALYAWLLNKYAQPGQRILDTHLGSGSSAIAAHYFGCEFVGMELDADYYKAAVERFKRETAQVAMEL